MFFTENQDFFRIAENRLNKCTGKLNDVLPISSKNYMH